MLLTYKSPCAIICRQKKKEKDFISKYINGGNDYVNIYAKS